RHLQPSPYVRSLPAMCGWYVVIVFFFFFSSRRRHTRFSRDWSSDVCSSDLRLDADRSRDGETLARMIERYVEDIPLTEEYGHLRSEERRVGKECRSRWSP